jgi:hypothetical protein
MEPNKRKTKRKRGAKAKAKPLSVDNVLWLSAPIHKNSLKIELTDDIKKSLLMSFDGTILGVDSTIVSSYIEDETHSMIRMGFKKMPDDVLKYSDEDGLYKFLSCLIDIE